MESRWRNLERRLKHGLGPACAFLLALCGLCACVAQPPPGSYPLTGLYGSALPGATVMPSPAGRRIAVLVALTGGNNQLGPSMLRAAKLALDRGPVSMYDTDDTKGTPEGAAQAVEAAVAAGAGIIVGPLTAAETAAVAPVARARGVPVLAFTSDTTKAQPGVWPMGLTPAQQVATLVRAAQADGRRRLGAVLPQNPFGDALADGLLQAAQEIGLPPPQIVRYQPGGLTGALEQIAASPATTPGVPPIDALLCGETGDTMLRALPTLTRLGLGPDHVRLLGTALWARDAARLGPLAGAWFAGPDPTTLHVFEQNYMAKYGTPPPGIASIAFDAAAAARAVSGPGGVDVNVLLNANGFSGANGVFVLLPDGHVRRSLALFEIGPNGAIMRGAGGTPGAPSVM